MTGPAPAAPLPHEYPKNKWTIAIAITFGTLMGTIDTSIINVALPHLRGTLSATVEEVTWISTGYVVASVIIMPLTAWLGTRFGRKRVYLTGLLVFLIGSLFCGAARSLWSLTLFRILQGLGAGALQPTEQAILRETFPPEEQGKAMALFGFAIMLGPAIGPTLGGWIVDNYSWPWIFYINIPVGALGLFMAWRYVEDPPYLVRSKGRVDWAGLALLVIGLAAIQTLLEQGEQHDWFESRLNVMYAMIGAFSVVMFIAWELTVDDPVVNLRVLQNSSFAIATAINSILSAVLFSSIFLLPIYMQELLRFNAMQSGLALMPRSLAMLVSIPIVGQIYNRISPRGVISFGLLLGALTCYQMSHFTLASSRSDILVPQMLQGLALACIFIPLQTISLAAIDRRRMSQATGLANLIRQLGGSFGIAIFAALLGRFTTRAKVVLATHVDVASVWARDRLALLKGGFMMRGADPGTAQAMAVKALDGQVGAQAAMLAFERAFFIAALMFLVSLPLVLLLDDGKRKEKNPAPHQGDEAHAMEI